MMLSIDAFEEEFREEYGKIFNNVLGVKASKKRKSSEKTDSCVLPTSYKKEERHKTDWLSQVSSRKGSTSEVKKGRKITAQCYENSFAGQRIGGLKRVKSRKKERSNNFPLYEKVAMDLEAVFNKHMMISSNTEDKNNMEREENFVSAPEFGNTPGQTWARNDARGKPLLRYKTVHTKNDTLYIWTASV